ncbi:MAG: SpoIIE family protein phosphatase [Planctomycetota bacterium]
MLDVDMSASVAGVSAIADVGRADEIERHTYEKILDVARRLASTRDLDEVLGAIIDALRDTLEADRASVFQYDRETHEFFATSAHGLPTDLRLPADLGLIGEAGKSKKIVNIPDAYSDERFNQSVDRSTGYRTRCILTIPLLDYDNELVGVAQVLNKRGATEAVFEETDEQIAQHMADQAAVALRRASLMDAELQKQKYERDINLARRIQQSALPSSLPDFPGYSVAGQTRPADETGGDAFDIIDLREEDIATPEGTSIDGLVFMGDATGHGIGPALSVTQVLAMIRVGCRLSAPPGRIAREVNVQLCRDLPIGRFVTAFIGQLDLVRHEMRWISAGQAPLLFLKAGSDEPLDEEELNANAMPLGIDDELIADDREPYRFDPGDVFILLSDGYYEAQNPEGVMLGHKSVYEHVRTVMHKSADEILTSLRGLLESHTRGMPAQDDETAVVIKRDV